ncbi:MAG: serine hydrolase domain-containing protein [Cyclobacteriaceae bacterium]
MKLKYLFFIGMSMMMFSNHKLNGQINSEELSRLVEQTREKYDLPAIAVVLISSDDLVLTEVQGVRVYNTNNEATLDDYFHIGSCSKSVLTLIAGKLVENGKIKWNTPFFEIFPELKSTSQKEYIGITLEDLFLCRAGIKAFTSDDEKFPSLDTTSSNIKYEFAKYLFRELPSSKYENGEFDFLYSNASYTLAALMLERVSELSYEELIALYIDEELGINTYMGFPNTFDSNQPWGHTINGESFDIFPPDHEYKIPSSIRPAGDLSMSPTDYARYIQLNLKGLKGVRNFVSSEIYQYIHFGHKGFSLGVANGKMAGHKYSGMDGSAGTFFCRAVIVPDSDFAFTINTNAGSGTGEMKAVDWLTMKILKKYYNWWWKIWI